MKCPNCECELLEKDCKTGRFGKYYRCPACNQNTGGKILELLQKKEFIEENKGEWSEW